MIETREIQMLILEIIRSFFKPDMHLRWRKGRNRINGDTKAVETVLGIHHNGLRTAPEDSHEKGKHSKTETHISVQWNDIGQSE